jgi:hypothetical protein
MKLVCLVSEWSPAHIKLLPFDIIFYALSTKMPPKYTSMKICLCDECYSKTHHTPFGVKNGLPFTPSEYQKHLQKINTSIPQKDHSSATGSSSTSYPQSNLQTTPYTFPPTQNQPLPPLQAEVTVFDSQRWVALQWQQNHQYEIIGMILSAVLYLMHHISKDAVRILTGSLNIINKALLKEVSATPYNLQEVPSTIETICHQLNLNPTLETYISCPTCFYLAGHLEDATNKDITCQRHCEPHNIGPPCQGTLLKEPHVSSNSNHKQKEKQESKLTPKRAFVYQPIKSWLARFLNRPGVEDLLIEHLRHTTGPVKKDIWDGNVWKRFTGPGSSELFMSKEDSLAFTIYIDWFNAFGKSSRHHKIGVIILVCLNLPIEYRLKTENVYIAGIIPGPKEPTGEQLNYLLKPLIKELIELWHGVFFTSTWKYPSGRTIHAAILTAIADVVAMRKLTGFIAHSGTRLCNFCTIHKNNINDIGPATWPNRRLKDHKKYVENWLKETRTEKRKLLLTEYGVRYSILEDLPYWDATRMVNLDIMHNLILGALKDHVERQLRLPDKTWKKPNIGPQATPDSSDDQDSDSPEDISDLNPRAIRALKRDAQQTLQTSMLSTPARQGVQQNIPSSSLTEQYDDDPDYAPLEHGSEPSSESTIHETIDFKFDHELLACLQEIIQKTDIPSQWTRVPKNIGYAAHGSLKASEWSLLYKVYIPIFFLLNEHTESPLDKHLKLSTFHLISAYNISSSWESIPEQGTAFTQQWGLFRKISQQHFPNYKSKPNHHLAEHIPELLLCWGPAPGTATWFYERLNGLLGKFPKNNKPGM